MFGLSLDELGISLINIRSTGFENVAVLFHNERIRKRCAIITDLDRAFIDTTKDILDSDDKAAAKKKALGAQIAGLQRQAALKELCDGNPWLTAHFADHTFEVDFVSAGNVGTVVSVLGDVYKDGGTIATSKMELESGDITRFGTRVLTMARYAGKGWFAIILGRMITPETVIPDYILDAIFQAHLPVSIQTWARVLDYRVSVLAESQLYAAAEIDAMRAQIRRYSSGEIDFAGVRAEMLQAFPSDGINTILAGF